MNKFDPQAARARCEAATDNWEVGQECGNPPYQIVSHGSVVADFGAGWKDIFFAVSARTDLPAALEALEEAQGEIERLRTALNQQGHVVEFREDGWAIEHPVECRKTSLLDCPLNGLSEKMGGPPTEGPGRYRAAISDDGNLLLDRILSKEGE